MISILAILPSNVDPATQEILKLAKKADPNMTRTMAVLTKPDLAIEPSMQQVAIDYVLDKRGELTLGYYIVKNRGSNHNDRTLEEGQAMEREFFSQAPWSALTERAGISCLKIRVRALLIDLIKKEFPKLKNDIAQQLQILRTKRSNMGPSRGDDRAQRAYLGGASRDFQLLVQDALSANYNRSVFFSDRYELRLITRVVEESESYADRITRYGHMRRFASDEDKDGDTKERHRSSISNGKPEDANFFEGFAEIQDILYEKDLASPTSGEDGDIMSYIENEYHSSRGQELGTVSFSPNVRNTLSYGRY